MRGTLSNRRVSSLSGTYPLPTLKKTALWTPTGFGVFDSAPKSPPQPDSGRTRAVHAGQPRDPAPSWISTGLTPDSASRAGLTPSTSKTPRAGLSRRIQALSRWDRGPRRPGLRPDSLQTQQLAPDSRRPRRKPRTVLDFEDRTHSGLSSSRRTRAVHVEDRAGFRPSAAGIAARAVLDFDRTHALDGLAPSNLSRTPWAGLTLSSAAPTDQGVGVARNPPRGARNAIKSARWGCSGTYPLAHAQKKGIIYNPSQKG